jgi:hypothetical protein
MGERFFLFSKVLSSAYNSVFVLYQTFEKGNWAERVVVITARG